MKLWNGALLVLALGSLAYAQPPAVNAGGIVNCGSYATGGVAAGSIVCIFGTNLASQTASAGSIPLPPALGNVRSVTFNGVDAPLYFVSSNQINAQVQSNLAAQAVFSQQYPGDSFNPTNNAPAPSQH